MANINRTNFSNAYELQPYPQEQYSQYQPSNQYNQSFQPNQPIAQAQIIVLPQMNGIQSNAHPINQINQLRTNFASRKCWYIFQINDKSFSTCNVFFGLIAFILIIMIGKFINDLKIIDNAAIQGDQSQNSQDIYAVAIVKDVIFFLKLYLCEFVFWTLASIFGCISVCVDDNNYTFLHITHFMLMLSKILLICGFYYAMRLISQIAYLSSLFYIGLVYGLLVPFIIVIWVFSLKSDLNKIDEMKNQIDSNPQIQ